MARLYGTFRSRATRALWLAGEIGLELELVPVWQAYRLDDPGAADAPLNTRSPAFLKISPAGAVPVLDDDGLILSESLAINLHLARRYGRDIGPRNEFEEALMDQWAFYGATAIEPEAVVIMSVHTQGRAGTPEGRAEIAAAEARLDRPLRVLDAQIAAHGGHVIGHRFTVADINMAEIVRYATLEPGLLDPYPAVKAWLAACHARPAFQAMWARREAEPLRP